MEIKGFTSNRRTFVRFQGVAKTNENHDMFAEKRTLYGYVFDPSSWVDVFGLKCLRAEYDSELKHLKEIGEKLFYGVDIATRWTLFYSSFDLFKYSKVRFYYECEIKTS